MTAIDRFDPFDQRIRDALEEIAAPRRPHYIDDVVRQTTVTRQRPRWTFPERWLPRTAIAAPARPAWPLLLLVALVLLALAAAAVLIAGARPPLEPSSRARNGAIVYARNGALWVRSSPSASDDRMLISTPSGPGDGLAAPLVAPDGRRLAFVEARSDGDILYGAVLDPGDPSRTPGASLLLDQAIQPGSLQMAWSPDSSFLLVTGDSPNGTRRLFKVLADGSGAHELILPSGLFPYDALPSPVDPEVFLLRAQQMNLRLYGLYLAHLDGTVGPRFDLDGVSAFGPEYALSGAQWSPDGSTIAYNASATMSAAVSSTTTWACSRAEPAPSGSAPAGGPHPDRRPFPFAADLRVLGHH